MYILFDIGGTKMRIAVSKNGKSIDDIKVVETPKRFDDGIARFKEVVNELSGGRKIKAMAGGVAGNFDRKRTKLINSTNISGWVNKPLKSELEKVGRAPVYLENDASLVGLGEAIYGSGKGKKIVVYLTVSTGVGGTRIVDGRIDESVVNFEPGNQIIFCSFDSKMETLERCISGKAFKERYKKPPYEVLDDKIWDEAAKNLAVGLNNSIVHWSPDIVVLGGSMMKKIGIPVDRVIFHLEKMLKIFPKHPIIKKAKLGDRGGIYGALVKFKIQNF